MLTPQELRIGNLVHATTAGNVGDGKLVVHTIKNGSDIDNAGWFFPLSLAEEWLLKFGFALNDFHRNKIFKVFELDNFFIILYKNKFWFLEAGCFLDDNYYEPTKEINFIHQLQNLYFALTGEELTPQ